MSSIDIYCEHQWDSSAPVRLCLRCGQIRVFAITGKLKARVLWPGRDRGDADHLLLSDPDKALIARFAKKYSITKVRDLTGIPWTSLRPWMNEYWGKPQPPEVAEAEMAVPPAPPEPTAAEPSTPSPEPPYMPKRLQPGYQPKGAGPQGRPTRGEIRQCAICGREFYAKRYLIERGRGLYCKDCRGKASILQAGHCPDCKGELKKDASGDKLLCQQCNKSWPTPPAQKEPMKRWKRQKSLEQDKEVIIRDYFEMRLSDFFRKWHISSNTWLKLKNKWNVPKKGYPPQRAHQEQTSKTGPELPEFPPFNDSWAPEVQAEWFKTYRTLANEGKGG